MKDENLFDAFGNLRIKIVVFSFFIPNVPLSHRSTIPFEVKGKRSPSKIKLRGYLQSSSEPTDRIADVRFESGQLSECFRHRWDRRYHESVDGNPSALYH